MTSIPNRISDFLADILNLQHDKEDDREIIESIEAGIDVRGTNLWVLVFAIVVASVGLNVNSTAVIIGAMLISPLMGPIMGIGLGLGISDMRLLRKAYRHLSVMVAVSVIASTVYFLLTPLSEARSELLARTSPTIYDVLIALFGGMAGIVGATRKSKGNVIPGVAIATALMPPLCTAGYGIATGKIGYVLGALYLFFINGVMIASSTYMFIRLLGLPRMHVADPSIDRRTQRVVIALVLITVLPSVYLGYTIIRDTLFQQDVQRFIREECTFPNAQPVSYAIRRTERGPVLDVFLLGERIPPSVIQHAVQKRTAYRLAALTVHIRQGSDAGGALDATKLNAARVDALYRQSLDLLERKDGIIDSLRTVSAAMIPQGTDAVIRELHALNPKIDAAAISRGVVRTVADSTRDTLSVAVLRSASRLSRRDVRTLQTWLQVRLQSPELRVVVERR